MKFFRKVRFNAIIKKGFRKYLLYAIGEILLVVLGILIALYLNGKKEDFNVREKQKSHFVLLKEELQNNLVTLTEEGQVLSDMISNIKELSNIISSESLKDEISESELSSLLFLPVSRSIEVNYENVAYSEFIVSNSLKDVQNMELRTILRSWDRKIQTLKMQEQVVKNSLSKAVDFIEINGSLKTIFDKYNLSETYLGVKNSQKSYSNKTLLKSRQFENILLQYLGVTTQLNKRNYPDFKEDISKLVSLIEEEIGKYN